MISPRRGRQLPGRAPTYEFAKISQKLPEIERIWTPGRGGGGFPHAPLNLEMPLDPAQRQWCNHQFSKSGTRVTKHSNYPL